MSALPSTADVHFDADGIRAWRLVLGAEAAALEEKPSSAKYRDNLIGVRVLGWFLKDFWDHPSCKFGMIPYRHLLSETQSCFKVDHVAIDSPEGTKAQYEKVFALGLMYRNHLIRVFHSDAGPIPTPSRHVSPPPFDKYREDMLLAMATAPKTRKDVKEIALHRDGYRCMISGVYDWKAIKKYPELYDGISPVVPTECVHVFPEHSQHAGQKYAATAFTMLEMFGLKDQVHELLGGQVNSPCNVLTMNGSLHIFFDEFDCWLEPVNAKPNTYNVCAQNAIFSKSGFGKDIPRCVTEVDPALVKECATKGVRAPDLPDSSLIAIRASCARVAHLSGAAEQSDEILRDMESISVLASDGRDADLLNSLLNRSFAGMEVSG